MQLVLWFRIDLLQNTNFYTPIICIAIIILHLALYIHVDTSEEGAELRDATAAAVRAATQDGAAWVLKPQREGGGNNFYGPELSKFLKDHQGDPALSGTFHRCIAVFAVLYVYVFVA